MSRQLTKKQRGFVKDFLNTGNGTQAVLKNYDTTNENSAAVTASRTLRTAKVQEYIQDHAEDAESMIYKLSQHSKQDFIKLNASKDIMDRAGYAPVSKSESRTLQLNLEARLEDKSVLEALRREYVQKLKRILMQ